ncbi:MAG TPA: hypothetical protein VIY51_10725 [Xanthobacteraceae bacterium]
MTTPETAGDNLIEVEGYALADDWKRWLCVGALLGLAMVAASILVTL